MSVHTGHKQKVHVVQIAESESSEVINISTEQDGTLFVDKLAAQFPNCSGLIYKDPQSNHLYIVSENEGKLCPPSGGGWNSQIFYCVFRQGKKRKAEIVKCAILGQGITKETLKQHFKQFGEVKGVKISKYPRCVVTEASITIVFNSDLEKKSMMEARHEIDGQSFSVEVVDPKGQKNTPGFGLYYEYLVPAYFALLLNNNSEVTNFKIRSNVEDFGNLDDVIIEVETVKDKYYAAFQLKHKEKNGTFTFSEITTYKKNFDSLKNRSEKEDEAFQKLMKKGENRDLFTNLKNDLEKYNFIFYTNGKFRANTVDKNMYTVMANQDNSLDPVIKIFYTGDENCANCYRFKPVEGKPVEGTEQFYSQFSFFACQNNHKGFEKNIRGFLKEENAVLKYIDFFNKWYQGRFTNKIIDKKTLNLHILDIFLSDFLITNLSLSNFQNEKLKLFEKVVRTFDVTVIDDNATKFLDKLANWEVLEVSEDMWQLARNYKIVDREVKELSDETKLKILCYFSSKILIINVADEVSANLVYQAMEFYQMKENDLRFVILGEGIDVTKFFNLRVFTKLNDLCIT